MRRAPSRWTLANLLDYCQSKTVQRQLRIGNIVQCVPARPEGFFSLASRLTIAYDVFRGHADALYWPEDDE